MNQPSYREILYEGLWKNNTSLVQLLGLCPLLAVSTNPVNGLGLGLATTLILILCNLTVSLVRQYIPNEVRIPVYVVLIACIVTSVELLIKAYFYDLYSVLGIFIPLIVTNCFVIGRAEAFASKVTPDRAALDGVAMGVGFTLALMVLGGMRELIGTGTIFGQADLMFGEAGKWLSITLFDHSHGVLLAILPPGAFFGLALMVAAKNWLDQRQTKMMTVHQTTPEANPVGSTL